MIEYIVQNMILRNLHCIQHYMKQYMLHN